MYRQPILIALSILLLGPASSAFGDLVGWWTFDETEGNIAADGSGQGNNGTIVGTPLWVPGKIGGALEFNGSTYVNCGRAPSLNIRDQITIAFWFKVGAFVNTWEAFLAKSDGAYRSSRGDGTGNGTHLGITGSNYFNAPTIITDNQWHHYCGTYDGTTAIIYIDGREDARQTYGGQIGDSSSYDLYIGENSGATGRLLHGLLDDIQIYNNALTVAEIQEIMEGLADASIAANPIPEDTATDVVRDVVLGWTAGEFAATHDVYFGTSFEDVNNATLPVASVTDTAFDPEGLLEYGQTYYWRVDEVNAAPDNTVFKGEVWSFTAETFAYPITNVTAVASVQQPASPASNTINGSGLDAFDQHGVDLKTMWVTPGGLPAWIQYTFDKEYKLHELWVWNANSELETFMGFGAKTVTIEYSTDGEIWTALENVPEFAKGTATATYAANNIIDLGEVMAKYVKLTVTATWGATGITSLSEVRFFYTPVQAFEPDPVDGATGVDLGATLNWRPGREATSHEVSFGADPNALATETVTDHRYTPPTMDFGTLYYWKVDEVGDTGTYAGDVWSFTSQEFEMADDFESYTDDIEAGTTIWQTWIDGNFGTTSGSQVGYDDSPFAEQAIVHGGKQSMPMRYDNDGTFREGSQYEKAGVPFYSEVEREFDPVQNWTGNGATDVGLWVRGYPAITAVAVTETGGKMSVTGAGVDIWNNSDEFTYAYKTLTGDGTLIARVVSNGTGTNAWAKGGVMIRDSLNGGSTHATMVMTAHSAASAAGNGASFQYRGATDGTSSNVDSGSVIAPPYWVKIERFADTFTGSVSADGKTWTQLGQTAITMTNPVYIGLCVTSHATGEDRTFDFDGIAGTGAISGAWQGAVINSPLYNAAADMSLTIEDSAGKKATATNATAVTAAEWTLWSTPMSDFAGVNFTKIKKVVITIGDKAATTAGGSGIVFIDDIGFGHPAQ